MRALDLLLRYRSTLSRYDTLEEETSQVLEMEGRKLTDKDMSSYWRFLEARPMLPEVLLVDLLMGKRG